MIWYSAIEVIVYAIVFVVTLWHLWKARCRTTFGDVETDSLRDNLINLVVMRASEIVRVYNRPAQLNKSSFRIRWTPPGENEVKLNTDGAAKGNPGMAGARGLIRDSNGARLVGFQPFLGACSNVAAELYARRAGLQLAWNEGYRRIVCEIDANDVISLINSGDVSFHPMASLVLDIRELLGRNWEIKLQHTWREGNLCADCLAKLGAESDVKLEVLRVAPLQVL